MLVFFSPQMYACPRSPMRLARVMATSIRIKLTWSRYRFLCLDIQTILTYIFKNMYIFTIFFLNIRIFLGQIYVRAHRCGWRACGCSCPCPDSGDSWRTARRYQRCQCRPAGPRRWSCSTTCCGCWRAPWGEKYSRLNTWVKKLESSYYIFQIKYIILINID